MRTYDEKKKQCKWVGLGNSADFSCSTSFSLQAIHCGEDEANGTNARMGRHGRTG